MKKLSALLITIAVAAGIYQAVDGHVFAGKPIQVEPAPAPQQAASSAVETEIDEASEVAEAPPPATTAQHAATDTVAPPDRMVPKIANVAPPAEVKIAIRDVQFDGVSAFSHEELKGVVQEFIGQNVTVEQAFSIPAKISHHYQSRNLVARATLVGSLDRADGVLKIGVIETRISQKQLEKELTAIAVAAPEPLPVPAPQAAPALPVAIPQESSQTLPGEGDETDFILKQYAKSSRQYELLADNHGYEATGSQRLGASLQWKNALAGGDKLSLMGLRSQGSQYLRMMYEITTGVDGLKLGASVSRLNYEVVNGLQSAVNRSGDALKKGVQLAYELVNTPGEYSTVLLNYETRNLNTAAVNTANSSAYNTSVRSIGLRGFERELVPGGAVFSYDTLFSQGEVNMAGSPNQAADASGEQTYGAFSKLRATGGILQPLGGSTSIYAGLTLQRANKNLDASEKMYLGGPTGVRAYGTGEGVGTDGELATVELRQKLGADTTLSEFYDWGHVRPWHNGSAPGAPAHNSAVLQGYGISLTHKFGPDTTVKGTWARRVGETPDPSSMPLGHDGQYDRNRFWLSVETRF